MQTQVTPSKVAMLLVHMIQDLGYEVAVRRDLGGCIATAVDLGGDQWWVLADDPVEAVCELARQVGISFHHDGEKRC